MLRRAWPERWLFVSWQNLDDPSRITRDWIIAWRNRLGERFYENDRIVINTDLIAREVDFAGRWALELQGLWENERKAAGGPFKSWAFYDGQTRQAFLIDIAVFNPGKEKIRFLRQLEIIVRTFRMQQDVFNKTVADWEEHRFRRIELIKWSKLPDQEKEKWLEFYNKPSPNINLNEGENYASQTQEHPQESQQQEAGRTEPEIGAKATGQV
ncbi:MAG: DUF4837 family protein [bacterium]